MSMPLLRFNAFSDEWNEKRLDELLCERHDIRKISDEYPQLSFTIEEGVINPNDRKTNKRDFLIKDKDNKKYLATELGDIIYNPSNIVFGAIHTNKYSKGCVSPIYKIFSTNQDSSFMGLLLRRSSFLKKLSNLTEGTVIKLKSLKVDDFLNVVVCIPEDLEEQRKISSFFNEIDNYISLNEEKLIELQSLKKSLMQKMFPKLGEVVPEIRFPGFDGEWEEKGFKEVVNNISTGLNPRKNFTLNSGGNNFYVTIKNFENGVLHLDEKCDKIDDKAIKVIQKRSKLQKGDILFSSIGRIGDCYLIEENPVNWNINESVFSIRPNNDYMLSEFMFYTFKSDLFIKQLNSSITGSTFKSIKIGQLNNFSILFPKKIEEQQKIGSFFKELDNRIELQRHKLDKIKEYKEGLLQQMFC